MTNAKIDLMAPEWQMEDAYGDIRSPRYEASVAEALEAVKNLEADTVVTRENVAERLALYDRAVTLLSSLASFVKCTGAKDGTDERVPAENARLAEIAARRDRAANTLFAFLETLPAEDALWKTSPLSDWAFVVSERRHDWHKALTETERDWLASWKTRCFTPLGDLFKTLQQGVDFEAENASGEKERIRAAKLISVIKGAPDRTLRRSVFEGIDKTYSKQGALHAALLNQLHGMRLCAFDRAGVAPLTVSLAQNRMSEKALHAMRETILSHIDEVREAVTLRAPYFGEEKLHVYDLMAPAPVAAKAASTIPYPEGIAIVKKALGTVSPELSGFIDTMLENRWVDAKPSEKKIGGAFYSRFNEFRIPRVFASYTGTITTVLQQAHELGHAFHYWMMRDLPVVQTEFPMTLTETASTFNEAVLRHHLQAEALAKNDREAHFGMLWQELRSAANFLMNTMVRMDFELAYLEERRRGIVSAQRACELMSEAWRLWYGDTTVETDKWLWAYKLHYYKTDQLIYNYPYTVGYLLSQGLMAEWKERGDAFFPFYKAMLRDTGRMTLDEIVAKHYGFDATKKEFWERCVAAPLGFVREFRNLYPHPAH